MCTPSGTASLLSRAFISINSICSSNSVGCRYPPPTLTTGDTSPGGSTRRPRPVDRHDASRGSGWGASLLAKGYRIELTAAQIDQPDNLSPAAGTHQNEEPMRMIDR